MGERALEAALTILHRPPDDRSQAEVQSLVHFTSSYPFFADITHPVHLALCRRARLFEARRSQLVCRQGQEGDAFFIILSGVLAVIDEPKLTDEQRAERLHNLRLLNRARSMSRSDKRSSNNQQGSQGHSQNLGGGDDEEEEPHLFDYDSLPPVALLYKGQSFGELALIESGKRSHTILAREPCRLLRIDRKDYLDLLQISHSAMLDEFVECLQKVPLFRSWTRHDLTRLSYFFESKTMPHKTIVEEDVFIVREGAVDLIHKRREDSTVSQLRVLSRRDLAAAHPMHREWRDVWNSDSDSASSDSENSGNEARGDLDGGQRVGIRRSNRKRRGKAAAAAAGASAVSSSSRNSKQKRRRGNRKHNAWIISHIGQYQAYMETTASGDISAPDSVSNSTFLTKSTLLRTCKPSTLLVMSKSDWMTHVVQQTQYPETVAMLRDMSARRRALTLAPGMRSPTDINSMLDHYGIRQQSITAAHRSNGNAFLDALSPGMRSFFFQRMVIDVVNKNHIVINQGEPVNLLFVVLSGAVSLYATTADATDVHLTTLTRGGHIGELALQLQQAAFPVTIVANTVVELATFSRADYEYLLQAIRDNTPDLHSQPSDVFPKQMVLDIFYGLDIFSSFKQSVLIAIAHATSCMTFSAGEVLLRQGTRSDGLYFLVEGEVLVLHEVEQVPLIVGDPAVHLANTKVKPLVLARLPAGSYFGESCMVRGEVPSSALILSATLITASRVRVFFISDAKISSLIPRLSVRALKRIFLAKRRYRAQRISKLKSCFDHRAAHIVSLSQSQFVRTPLLAHHASRHRVFNVAGYSEDGKDSQGGGSGGGGVGGGAGDGGDGGSNSKDSESNAAGGAAASSSSASQLVPSGGRRDLTQEELLVGKISHAHHNHSRYYWHPRDKISADQWTLSARVGNITRNFTAARKWRFAFSCVLKEVRAARMLGGGHLEFQGAGAAGAAGAAGDADAKFIDEIFDPDEMDRKYARSYHQRLLAASYQHVPLISRVPQSHQSGLAVNANGFLRRDYAKPSLYAITARAAPNLRHVGGRIVIAKAPTNVQVVDRLGQVIGQVRGPDEDNDEKGDVVEQQERIQSDDSEEEEEEEDDDDGDDEGDLGNSDDLDAIEDEVDLDGGGMEHDSEREPTSEPQVLSPSEEYPLPKDASQEDGNLQSMRVRSVSFATHGAMPARGAGSGPQASSHILKSNASIEEEPEKMPSGLASAGQHDEDVGDAAAAATAAAAAAAAAASVATSQEAQTEQSPPDSDGQNGHTFLTSVYNDEEDEASKRAEFALVRSIKRSEAVQPLEVPEMKIVSAETRLAMHQQQRAALELHALNEPRRAKLTDGKGRYLPPSQLWMKQPVPGMPGGPPHMYSNTAKFAVRNMTASRRAQQKNVAAAIQESNLAAGRKSQPVFTDEPSEREQEEALKSIEAEKGRFHEAFAVNWLHGRMQENMVVLQRTACARVGINKWQSGALSSEPEAPLGQVVRRGVNSAPPGDGSGASKSAASASGPLAESSAEAQEAFQLLLPRPKSDGLSLVLVVRGLASDFIQLHRGMLSVYLENVTAFHKVFASPISHSVWIRLVPIPGHQLSAMCLAITDLLHAAGQVHAVCSRGTDAQFKEEIFSSLLQVAPPVSSKFATQDTDDDRDAEQQDDDEQQQQQQQQERDGRIEDDNDEEETIDDDDDDGSNSRRDLDQDERVERSHTQRDAGHFVEDEESTVSRYRQRDIEHLRRRLALRSAPSGQVSGSSYSSYSAAAATGADNRAGEQRQVNPRPQSQHQKGGGRGKSAAGGNHRWISPMVLRQYEKQERPFSQGSNVSHSYGHSLGFFPARRDAMGAATAHLPRRRAMNSVADTTQRPSTVGNASALNGTGNYLSSSSSSSLQQRRRGFRAIRTPTARLPPRPDTATSAATIGAIRMGTVSSSSSFRPHLPRLSQTAALPMTKSRKPSRKSKPKQFVVHVPKGFLSQQQNRRWGQSVGPVMISRVPRQ